MPLVTINTVLSPTPRQIVFDRKRVHRQPAINRDSRSVDFGTFILDRNVDRARGRRAVILTAGDSAGVVRRHVFAPRSAFFLEKSEWIAESPIVRIEQFETKRDGIDLGTHSQFVNQPLNDERVVTIADRAST